MSQKSLPAHRDYPDAEPSDDKDLEQSYDGPDVAYDEIDAEQDNADPGDRDIFNLWPSDQVNNDARMRGDGAGDPAPDVFPDSLFDDLRVVKSAKVGPGHGDS